MRATHRHPTSSGDLELVRSAGSGDIKVSEVGSAKLKVDTDGSGSVVLGGAVGSLEIHTTGSGDVTPRDLEARWRLRSCGELAR